MSNFDETQWAQASARRFDPIQRTVGFPIPADEPARSEPSVSESTPSTNRRWLRHLPSWQRRLLAIAIGLATACTAAFVQAKPNSPIKAWGIIDGRTIAVPARIGGVLTKVLVRPGDSVTQGQLLATIDEKHLASHRTQNAARQEFREVRAPVAGRVVNILPSVGEFVPESTCVAEVLDENSIVARLYLPDSTANDAGQGQPLRLVRPSGTEADALGTFVVERRGEVLVPLPDRIPMADSSDRLAVEVVARPQAPSILDTLRVGSVVALIDSCAPDDLARSTPGSN